MELPFATASQLFWSGATGDCSGPRSTAATCTAPSSTPRGGWDDDDYTPALIADDVAVFWLAGPDSGTRTSDSAPLTLHVACH